MTKQVAVSPRLLAYTTTTTVDPATATSPPPHIYCQAQVNTCHHHAHTCPHAAIKRLQMAISDTTQAQMMFTIVWAIGEFFIVYFLFFLSN
jgi:hypothetical protein